MKQKRSILHLPALALSLLLLAGTPAVSAAAAEVSTVTAQLRPGVSILVDGTERTFYNAQGQEVHAIYRGGTHYLPIRAIGELMGKNVNWDQSTLTITLAGARTIAPVQGTPASGAGEQEIPVQVRPDFTIVVDRTVRAFTDQQGSPVYPLLHNGTTYLPVRAIGQLMGKTVGWDGRTLTITLDAPSGGSLVTDADSFHQSGGSPQPGAKPGSQPSPSSQPKLPEPTLTREQAKAAALTDAGLAESQVSRLRLKLDRDDGHWEYSVEFVSGTREYEYEIDAATGAVLSRDVDSIYD